jgi:hypothetical protein
MYSLQTFERCFYGAPFWAVDFHFSLLEVLAKVLETLAFISSTISFGWFVTTTGVAVSS